MHELCRDVKKIYDTFRSVVLLGAAAKLRKTSLMFVISVCMSISTEELGSHWANVHQFWYMSVSRKSVEKIQVSLKYDKNNGTLHESLATFMIISRSILLVWEIFQTNLVEKFKTTFYDNNFFSCIVPFMISCGIICCSRTGHRLQCNRAHSLCVLDIWWCALLPLHPLFTLLC